MADFDPSVVQDVVAHMNSDHLDDNLLIVRAHGAPGGPISERAEAEERCRWSRLASWT